MLIDDDDDDDDDCVEEVRGWREEEEEEGDDDDDVNDVCCEMSYTDGRRDVVVRGANNSSFRWISPLWLAEPFKMTLPGLEEEEEEEEEKVVGVLTIVPVDELEWTVTFEEEDDDEEEVVDDDEGVDACAAKRENADSGGAVWNVGIMFVLL